MLFFPARRRANFFSPRFLGCPPPPTVGIAPPLFFLDIRPFPPSDGLLFIKRVWKTLFFRHATPSLFGAHKFSQFCPHREGFPRDRDFHATSVDIRLFSDWKVPPWSVLPEPVALDLWAKAAASLSSPSEARVTSTHCCCCEE